MDSRSTPNQALTTREAARGTISQCLLDLGSSPSGWMIGAACSSHNWPASWMCWQMRSGRRGSGWGGPRVVIKREHAPDPEQLGREIQADYAARTVPWSSTKPAVLE